MVLGSMQICLISSLSAYSYLNCPLPDLEEGDPVTHMVLMNSSRMLLAPFQEHLYTLHTFWRLFRGPNMDSYLTRRLVELNMVFLPECDVGEKEFPHCSHSQKKIHSHP